MENHDFLMQLFIIIWCGYFIMSCGFFIMSRGYFSMSCGYFIIWFVHRCDVVSSLCFVDFTSGTKFQHPGFTRYQQLVKPVLRGASVPALSRSCSLACEGKTSRRVFRRTSLISKFAAERIEPENVSELFDDELVRLGLTSIGDRHRVRALCANTEKRICLWLQLLLANAWLFSADVVAAVERVDLVRKEKFLRRELDSIKLSFVQPAASNREFRRRQKITKASAWVRHNGSINSKRAHPPRPLLGISSLSIQFNFIHTFIKYLHYIQ